MSYFVYKRACGTEVRLSTECLRRTADFLVHAAIEEFSPGGGGIVGLVNRLPGIVIDFATCQLGFQRQIDGRGIATCLNTNHALWAAFEKKVISGIAGGLDIPVAALGAIAEAIAFVKEFIPCVLSSTSPPSNGGDQPAPPSGVPVPGPIGERCP